MDDHTGRFVDDDDVFVLIPDIEPDFFGLHVGFNDGGDGGLDLFASRQAVAGAGGLSVDEDQSVADQTLPLNAGQFGTSRRQSTVQPFVWQVEGKGRCWAS